MGELRKRSKMPVCTSALSVTAVFRVTNSSAWTAIPEHELQVGMPVAADRLAEQEHEHLPRLKRRRRVLSTTVSCSRRRVNTATTTTTEHPAGPNMLADAEFAIEEAEGPWHEELGNCTVSDSWCGPASSFHDTTTWTRSVVCQGQDREREPIPGRSVAGPAPARPGRETAAERRSRLVVRWHRLPEPWPGHRCSTSCSMASLHLITR